MGKAGRDQVAEKIALAAWLVGSRLTLDMAVSEVAGAERHAEELRDLLPPSRRQPAWAQHTAVYINTLNEFVSRWRRRFSDETAAWDQARPTFLADIEALRESRAVLVDYLAGRPHVPAVPAVDPVPAPAAAPVTAPRKAEPARVEQRQEPEPIDAPPLVDDEHQEREEPAAAPWPFTWAEHHQADEESEPDDEHQERKGPELVDDDAEPAPVVSLWPGIQNGRRDQDREEPALDDDKDQEAELLAIVREAAEAGPDPEATDEEEPQPAPRPRPAPIPAAAPKPIPAPAAAPAWLTVEDVPETSSTTSYRRRRGR